MGVLDQVTDLKNQGMQDSRIISTLREQGVPPKQINDALNQAKIKSAVSSEKQGIEMEPSIMPAPKPIQNGQTYEGGGADLSNEDLTPPPAYENIPPAAQRSFGRMTKEASEEEGGQSSGATSEQENIPVPHPGQTPQNYYAPSTQEQENYYTPEPQEPEQDQTYYPQQDYQDYGYAPTEDTSGGIDSDTMIEISEQVFSEKSKPIQKSVDDLSEISTLIQSKIENFSDRLKRIESTIDKLQNAILEKIGAYGTNIDSIKKEMGMMQDSFGKIVNTALDHEERKHHAHTTPVQRIKKTTTVVHKSAEKKSSRKK